MFNTPFGFNGFNAFPGFQGQGFPGQGFQGSTPSWNQGWNQGWNSTPWSFGNDWQANAWNTPWGWNPQSFGNFGSPFAGFQGFNGISPWNQSSSHWTPFNWFNSPFASQFGGQFGSQFGPQFQTPQAPQTPFGFNWWNNENAPSESGAPFNFNPFTGFNPATQAA